MRVPRPYSGSSLSNSSPKNFSTFIHYIVVCPIYCPHFSVCKKRGRSREEDEELGFRRERGMRAPHLLGAR
jgi:hypothetical protein